MKAPLFAAAAVLASVAGFSFLAVEPTPSAAQKPAAAVKYEIDNVHSSVIFRVRHMSTGFFYGRFNSISGEIAYDPGSPKDSNIEVSVKADSVDSNNKDRDEHLKSPDFLSAKEFPSITFKSTKVEKKGGAEFVVTGDLTLHGVTKSVTVSVPYAGHGVDPMGMDRVGFEAKFEIDPKQFQINYMTDDKMLGPGIQLILGVEGTRKP
jgi:polyisoprenoid-binding protein YceI